MSICIQTNSPTKGLMVNSCPPWPNEAVVEIQLLLPALQAKLLDDLAYARGKSLGRLVRDLLQDYLAQQGSHPSPGPGDLPGVSEPGKSRLAEYEACNRLVLAAGIAIRAPRLIPLR